MTSLGWVFAPGSATRVAADITVISDGVRASSPSTADSPPLAQVPWAELRLEMGGAEGGMVFCHHRGSGAVICSDDRTFLAALRAEHDPRLREQFAALDCQRRSRAFRRRAVWLSLILLVLLLGLGAWLVVTWGVRHATDAMPTSVDRELGDAAMRSMDLGGERIAAASAEAAEAAVAMLVARLKAVAARTDFDFRIAIVDSAQINAFALPGGQIVVYTGLLRRAERAEQVAGVLAHEMAHVTLRHGAHGLARTAGIVIAFQIVLGDPSGLGGLAAQGAMSAVINGYSREQERAADAEGARMLAAAGLDVRGLSEFFTLLKDEPGSEATGIARWFSTHPDHDERIADITALAARLQPEAPPALAVDWAAVRASLPTPPAR